LYEHFEQLWLTGGYKHFYLDAGKISAWIGGRMLPLMNKKYLFLYVKDVYM
jgi:hypothetical protein